MPLVESTFKISKVDTNSNGPSSPRAVQQNGPEIIVDNVEASYSVKTEKQPIKCGQIQHEAVDLAEGPFDSEFFSHFDNLLSELISEYVVEPKRPQCKTKPSIAISCKL